MHAYYTKTFKLAFLAIILVECISLIAHLYPAVNTLAFVTIALIGLVLSFSNLRWAVYLLSIELFIGSFGYLFYWTIGDLRISIRLVLFLVVILGWIYHCIQKREISFLKTNLVNPFLFLLAALVMGLGVGILSGHALGDIFFDMNAYLFLALLPVAVSLITSWSRVQTLITLLLASVTTICLKTLSLLFFFAHTTDPYFIRMIYTWVRDTRIGEIAAIVDRYHRIFFQGHIWVLIAFFLIVFLLTLTTKHTRSKGDTRLLWLLLILTSTTLVVSFSRSLWISGVFVMLMVAGYLYKKEKKRLKQLCLYAAKLVLIFIIDVLLITALVNIQLPGSDGGVSAASLIQKRITQTDEAALKSRWELLTPLAHRFLDSPLWGSGFAEEVSYQTLDPRTRELDGGWYTTYSFEWGYLDIGVKMGLIGLTALFWFLWIIVKNNIRRIKETRDITAYAIRIGLLFGLFSLIILHATTPYINHPLGLFLIIILGAIGLVRDPDDRADKHPRLYVF